MPKARIFGLGVLLGVLLTVAGIGSYAYVAIGSAQRDRDRAEASQRGLEDGLKRALSIYAGYGNEIRAARTATERLGKRLEQSDALAGELEKVADLLEASDDCISVPSTP